MGYLAITVLVSFIATTIAMGFLMQKPEQAWSRWTQACLTIWCIDVAITMIAGFYWLICRIVQVNAFQWSFGG